MSRRVASLLPWLLLAACATPGGTMGGYLPADWEVVGDGLIGGDGVPGVDAGTPLADGQIVVDTGPAVDTNQPPADTAGCPSCCKGNDDCEDGDPCTQDQCNLGNGECSHPKISGCGELLQPCSAAAPCVKGVCDPVTNACMACVTSKDCGSGQLCQANACKPAPSCQSDVQCKATNQVCAKAEGACVDCNAHPDCQPGQACIDHACVPAPDCQSSKDCAKVCDVAMGKCVQCLGSDDCPNAQWCSPLRKCMPAICTAAGCAGKAAFPCKIDGGGYESAPACDDGKLCTDDGCFGGVCAHPANAAPCNDDNPCTINDACAAGQCTGGTAKCDDGNGCTTDSCSPNSGCIYSAGGGSCDDGNICTQGDNCKGGACVGGPKKNCDDSNACTDDYCDPTSGCKHTNNTKICDDNNKCTDKDFCLGGVCKGNNSKCDDGKLCTDDGCDPNGGCKYTPNTVPCDDANPCSEDDACKSGSCAPGKTKSCDDANPCTNDTCDKLKGCLHTNNTAYCNDGNACTKTDKCSFGKCAGTTLTCNDYKVCTNDSCDAAKGCVYVPHTLPCDDGDKCTKGDVCKSGTCLKGAEKVVCDDKDACTDDACSPAKGCQYVSNANKCNDSKPCTLDSCDKTTGKCSNAAIKDCCELHAQCDDKDACSKDYCAGNKCVHESTCCGTAQDCADGDACTLDACDAGKCSNVAKPEACDTKGVVFDFEDGTLQGWTPGATLKNLNWTNQAIVGPKGKKSMRLGHTSASSFSGVYGTSNYYGLKSPEIKLAAGQSWKIQIDMKLDVVGQSTYNRLYFYFNNDAKDTYISYKSIVSGNTNWTTWEYDVSAYAGVPFKFELRGRIGASSSSYSAKGAGLFVDEVRFVSDGKAKTCKADSECKANFGCLAGSCLGGTCTYIHKCCTKAADCDDGKTCTTDACSGGKCKCTAAAGCCQSTFECDDGKICTLDQCAAGKCTHAKLAECCESNADCDDGDNVCTVDTCTAGKCTYKNTCCKADSDCDDKDDKCTTDKCLGGKCTFTGTGAEGCCLPVQAQFSFDDDNTTGMAFSNTGGPKKGWQLWNPAPQFKSGKGVLYYGDPLTKNFSFGSTSGTATMPAVQVAADKITTLRMWAWFGTEKSSTYDKLTIYAKPEGGSKTTLWVKNSSTAISVWNDLKLPLPAATKGKKVTISLHFTTVDSAANSGLGVLIDDLRFEQTCP